MIKLIGVLLGQKILWGRLLEEIGKTTIFED